MIDSHILVWSAISDRRLTGRARLLIEDERTEILVSIATLWELSSKMSRGRLRLPGPPEEAANLLGADLLPVRLEHIVAMRELPPLHGDPFDRMLIAQALAEGVPLLSGDRDIARYDVPVIW